MHIYIYTFNSSYSFHTSLLKGIMGKYPIHLHVSENVEGTVVAQNVVRESNQRCIVVHGTHNATIYDNVAFGAKGHCIMLEDGGEVSSLPFTH